MLHRIACARINGVGIAFAVFVVKPSVVSARSQTAVGQFQNGGNLVFDHQRVVYGTIYPDAPFLLFGIFALCYNLAADFYEIVFNSKLVKQTGYHIAAVTFGNGAAIELGVRILLHHPSALREAHLAVSHALQKFAYLVGIYTVFFLKTKAPCVHKRRNGDIECAVGVVGNLVGKIENVAEHAVYPHVAVLIDGCDNAPLVERGKRGIDHRKTLVDFLLYAMGIGICDVVVSSEHFALVGYVFRVAVARHYHYAAYYQRHEKQQLQNSKVSFFHL